MGGEGEGVENIPVAAAAVGKGWGDPGETRSVPGVTSAMSNEMTEVKVSFCPQPGQEPAEGVWDVAFQASVAADLRASLELVVPWNSREVATSWAWSTRIPAEPGDPGDPRAGSPQLLQSQLGHGNCCLQQGREPSPWDRALGHPTAHPSIGFGIFNLA